MKPSVKAALVSALVFPGAGHFFLRRAARGCIFLVPAALAVAVVLQHVLERSNAILAQIESGAVTLDPVAIAALVSAPAGSEGPLMTGALIVCAICWAGSIVDSFILGGQGRPRV